MLVKAARWRANTFNYSRQDACAPRQDGSRSQAGWLSLVARDGIVSKFGEFVGVRTYLAGGFLSRFRAPMVG